ncbi:MAG: (2Fe-2S)-binding protein [Chloroflexota bacterium]
MTEIDVQLAVNGRTITLAVRPNELLLDTLRDRLRLTGAKRSCDMQVCGACAVLLDGEAISSCCTLAVDADGHDILTIEGLAQLPEFAGFEEAFSRQSSFQCGFCTAGMLLTVKSLLDSGELTADTENIKRNLSGNLCRCSGYRGIVDAVRDLVSDRRQVAAR